MFERYNNLLSAGTNLGYYNGNQTDLTAWQTATSMDANSISINPQFTSPTDLHVLELNLNATGTPVVEVTDDIDGDPRDLVIPDIGADEFDPPTLDAGISAIITPGNPAVQGINHIEVTLRNYGLDTITGASIFWRVYDTVQPAFNWTGILPQAGTVNVVIDTYSFAPNQTYNVASWSEMPNAQVDPFPANDTSFLNNIITGMSGIYTIGGASPDFVSFTEAIDTMNSQGLAGAVTFNVRTGIYNEQIIVSNVTGVSAVNTITFQSESLDSSDVALSYSAGSTFRYTLLLDGAQYVTFQHMTIQATNTSYGRVVEIMNNADFNSFRHVRFEGVNVNSTQFVYYIA